MAPPALRPENAIRRADELVSVGEPMAALQSLFDLLSSRRSRFADAATLEPIIFKFLELGVELRKGKMIKEGLYQYKKHMQHTPEGLISVGAVARKFIDLIETKMTNIQAQADAKEESNKDQAEEDLEGGVTQKICWFLFTNKNKLLVDSTMMMFQLGWDLPGNLTVPL